MCPLVLSIIDKYVSHDFFLNLFVTNICHVFFFYIYKSMTNTCIVFFILFNDKYCYEFYLSILGFYVFVIFIDDKCLSIVDN